jgi:soluble lytic murein transglycosylase
MLIIIVAVFFLFFEVFKVQKIILKKVYPEGYKEYVTKHAEEYNIDPLLIYSIIKAESNFKSDVKSSSDAVRLNANNGSYGY